MTRPFRCSKPSSSAPDPMQCLIIAAGQGRRLRHQGDSKPLVPLLGVPLIERVIRAAREAGADDFYVVIGYQGDRLRTFLTRFAQRLAIRMTVLLNDEWEKENGLSVLKADGYLTEPFLLLMADHVFDPAGAQALMHVSLEKDAIALGVDVDLHNPLIDMADVTRVKTDGSRITQIGKGLSDFNGFDTGIFVCTPAIFGALTTCIEQNGNATLSAAVQVLAARGKATAVPIRGFWIDVDDPVAFGKAERALLAQLRDKPNDGPVARYVNRPLSIRLSRRLVQYAITPNHISVFSFGCSVLAAGLFVLGSYATLVAGGVLAQFASIIDGSDGEVARLTFQSSTYGGWLDAVLDRYADAFLLFGLTWYAYADTPQGLVLVIGFLAIIGSFMVSYTADKYDHLMATQISRGRGFRLGRDVRVFLIFLAAICNQVCLVLGVIAVLMNLETIRRLIVCRHDG